MIVMRMIGAKISKLLGDRGCNLADVDFKEPFYAIGADHPSHNCFVNSPRNPIGLKVKYFASGKDGVSCIWENTDKNFEGYPNIVHGGVVASILDALMANALLRVSNLVGVTADANISWLRPVAVGEQVKGFARVSDMRGQVYEVEAMLFNKSGKKVAKASALFFTPTLDHFKKMIGNDDSADVFAENFHK